MLDDTTVYIFMDDRYKKVNNWSGFFILHYYWITGFTKASLASSMMSTIGTTRSII